MRKIRVMLPQRWHVNLHKYKGNFQPLRYLLMAALVFVAFWVTIFWVESHLRPIVEQMATARVNYLASKAVNTAISTRLSEEDVSYGDLVIFEKDYLGGITALKTDMIKINRLKADIINHVLDALQKIGPTELGVPLGNVINGELFSGRGPLIPVRIVPLGTASADFHNVFSSAGINQTRHQIMLEVTVDISVLLPGYAAATEVLVQVVVAETIIVGGVPDSYTHFEDGEEFFSQKEKYGALDP